MTDSNPLAAPWAPLLDGAAARAAQEAVAAIAADLAARLAEERERAADLPIRSVLARGPAGTALFFAYAHLASPDQGWDDLSMQAIEDALATVAERSLIPGLFAGFTGVGWALRHLENRIFEAEDDPGADVERVLLQSLAGRTDRVELVELIAGLAGFGVYFLERLPLESSRRGAELVIERLAALAEEPGDGLITWRAPEALDYDLGVSHGVPGVIGFLAAAHRRGVAAGEARRLATGAVRWLLAQRLPAGPRGLFPGFVRPGAEPAPSRLAWCYGDPGIATVLLLAARSFGRADWEQEALACARHAAGRREPETGVVDAGLCHGAAGLGHLFHRLFRATGDEALRQAAVFWLEQALAMRRPGRGVGGFLSPDPTEEEGTEDGQRPGSDDPGFLTGAAGVGLALLAAVSAVEPEWDRLLLLSGA